MCVSVYLVFTHTFTPKSKQTINDVCDDIEEHNVKRRMLMPAKTRCEKAYWTLVTAMYIAARRIRMYNESFNGLKYDMGHAKYILSLIQNVFQILIKQSALVIVLNYVVRFISFSL